MFDSHCHPTDMVEPEAAVEAARQQGVQLLCCGYDPESNARVLALREQTGLSISIADQSLNCVALGTGKALEYEKQLRHVIDFDS